MKGSLGRGYLDLYDYSNHSYYEVKSSGAVLSPRTGSQILKYDSANQMGKPVYQELTSVPKLSKGEDTIKDNFKYGYYTIYYERVAPGMIVYDPKWNGPQTQTNYDYETDYSLIPAAPSTKKDTVALAVAFIPIGVALGGMLGRMDNMRAYR